MSVKTIVPTELTISCCLVGYLLRFHGQVYALILNNKAMGHSRVSSFWHFGHYTFWFQPTLL